MHEGDLRFSSENGFVLFLASEHLSFKLAFLLPLTLTTYKISAFLSPKMHFFLYLATASEEIMRAYYMIRVRTYTQHSR